MEDCVSQAEGGEGRHRQRCRAVPASARGQGWLGQLRPWHWHLPGSFTLKTALSYKALTVGWPLHSKFLMDASLSSAVGVIVPL